MNSDCGNRKCIPKAMATTQQRKPLSPDCKSVARGCLRVPRTQGLSRAPTKPPGLSGVFQLLGRPLRGHVLWCLQQEQRPEASAASPEAPWRAENWVTKQSGPLSAGRKRKKTRTQEGKFSGRRVLCFKRVILKVTPEGKQARVVCSPTNQP